MRTTADPNRIHADVDDTFFSAEELRKIADKFATPWFIYDEQQLRQKAELLQNLFQLPRHKHYIPVCRCPHSALLNLYREMGFGAQCATPEELRLALDCGFGGSEILYETMSLSREFSEMLADLQVGLLAGSTMALRYRLPDTVYLFVHLPTRNNRLGVSKTARYRQGMTAEELPRIIHDLRKRGVPRIGLWHHYEGNVTEEDFLSDRMNKLKNLSMSLAEQGAEISAYHMDGGLGVAFDRYKPKRIDQELVNKNVSSYVPFAEEEITFTLGDFVIGPCALYVTSVLAVEDKCNPDVIVDGSPADIRFTSADHYHHTSLAGMDWLNGREMCSVYSNRAGNGEWLARGRLMHHPKANDLIVMHDMGACIQSWEKSTVLFRDSQGKVSRL